ncbi:MAG TPA: hypothetical protein VF603_10045 [Allosphingosinicella sp.]
MRRGDYIQMPAPPWSFLADMSEHSVLAYSSEGTIRNSLNPTYYTYVEGSFKTFYTISFPVIGLPFGLSQGVVFASLSTTDSRLVISFRGTDEWIDELLGTDANYYKEINANGYSSTLLSYAGMFVDHVKWLISAFPRSQVVFTGHSLGGMVAEQFVQWYYDPTDRHHLEPNGRTIIGASFGGPGVMDVEWAPSGRFYHITRVEDAFGNVASQYHVGPTVELHNPASDSRPGGTEHAKELYAEQIREIARSPLASLIGVDDVVFFSPNYTKNDYTGDSFHRAIFGGELTDLIRAPADRGLLAEGEGGDDILYSGPYADVLSGGDQSDTVVFNKSEDQYRGSRELSTGAYLVEDRTTGVVDRLYGVEFLQFGSASRIEIGQFDWTGSKSAPPSPTPSPTPPTPTNPTDTPAPAPPTTGQFTWIDTLGVNVFAGTSGKDVVAGLGGADDLSGQDGNDTLMGNGGADKLSGGAGDDLLIDDDPGSLAADILIGGSGNDTLVFYGAPSGTRDTGDGGTGRDMGYIDLRDSTRDWDLVEDDGEIEIRLDSGTSVGRIELDNIETIAVFFGSGDDFAHSGDQQAYYEGGAGDDQLTSEGRNDYLDGGPGDDKLDAGTGEDWIDGGTGNDRAEVDLSDQSRDLTFVAAYAASSNGFTFENGTHIRNVERIELETGRGDDRIWLGKYDDDVTTGGGDDVIFTELEDHDSVDGGSGWDRLVVDLSDSNDRLRSSYDSSDNDFEISRTDQYATAEDRLHASSIEELVLLGGSANDTLRGGRGDDELFGNGGDDSIRGGDGDDRMEGGSGDDDLYVGNGADYADGGSGSDYGSLDKSDADLDFVFDTRWASTSSGQALADGTFVRNIERWDVDLGDGNDTVTTWVKTDRNIDLGSGDNTIVVDHRDQSTVLLAGPGSVINIPSFLVSVGQAYDTASDRIWVRGADRVQVYGGEGADILSGLGRSDILNGGGGDDILSGGAGNDVFIGGAGTDTARYYSARAASLVLTFGGTVAVFDQAIRERDWMNEVETLQFNDALIPTASLPQFRYLDYVAGYDDLLRSIGINGQAAFEHFVNNGFFEGRSSDAFDGFQYIASHNDLIRAFGANEALAVDHFISHGFAEGRSRDSFGALQYIATYSDLARTFGANEQLGTLHFINRGFAEGRVRDGFDGLQYIAGYNDLVRLLGANEEAGAGHFLRFGMTEGRARDSFDGMRYVAGYDDLMRSIGADEHRAAEHYITQGFAEGRSRTAFDGLQYIATYNDLIRTFGANEPLGFQHFVQAGFAEGRTRDGFDALQYVAGYADLARSFGANEQAATIHFITRGFAEGRVRDGFDGLQYIAGYDDLIRVLGSNEPAAASHYLRFGMGEGRARDSFDGLQYIASYGDLIRAFGANEHQAAAHFIASGFGEGRVRDTFDAAQYLNNYSDLKAAFGNDQNLATLHYINQGFFEGRVDDVIVA